MHDFRETLTTVDKRGRRKWVYPTIVAGGLRFRRKIVAVVLLAVYLLTPWLVIGDRQAVRFDILRREFTVLGSTFYATDTMYLFLILGTLAFSLFLFTALLGRVWCGWACPQTVFLEFVFRPIERLIEGEATQRRRLDDAPWSASKTIRKFIKFTVFAVVSWGLASTLLAYFVGREELLAMMTRSPAAHPALFAATLFMMGALLFEFGWFREQFCSVLCPYARFQSVLMDRNSLAVLYDSDRGEPRGKKGKTTGDCVDCGLCVRVCPTGIDIRNGLQLECVQCSACVDACDSVMTTLGRSPRLIGFSTENVLAGQGFRFFRPRTALYAAIVACYLAALAFGLSSRRDAAFQVIRQTGVAPFVVQGDDYVMNHFKLHLQNRGRGEARFTVGLLDAGSAEAVVPVSPMVAAPQSDVELPLFVRFRRSMLSGGAAVVRIEVFNDTRSVGVQSVPLIGPDR